MIIHRDNTIDYCVTSFSNGFRNAMKKLDITTIGQAWDYVLANSKEGNNREYKKELLVYFQNCQLAHNWLNAICDKMCPQN